MQRIGVIGDVHAEHENLAAAIEFLKRQSLDLILCAGDVADGQGDVNRCCELLAQNQIPTVRGNHDDWLLTGVSRGVEHATRPEHLTTASRTFLESLPATRELRTAAGTLMLCHGLGEDHMACLRPGDSAEEIYNNLELWALYRRNDLQIVINGHTHRREVGEFHHLAVITAGTLHRGWKPGFAIVDLAHSSVQFLDIQSDKRILPSDGFRWTKTSRGLG